jgi:hypothetical protein
MEIQHLMDAPFETLTKMVMPAMYTAYYQNSDQIPHYLLPSYSIKTFFIDFLTP